MAPILLMNPNANAATTAMMCAIAATRLAVAPTPWTAPAGPGMITTRRELARAADTIAGADIEVWPRVIIVSAFGDPGALRLSRRAPCPVVGIAAAAAREASSAGGGFAVATTTPALRPTIDSLMTHYADRGCYLGCFSSPDDPVALAADEAALDRALIAQIEAACEAGASRVVIGGGPLGAAAERLREISPVPLINPILSAADEVRRMIGMEEPRNR
ncbi:aspartate/glutamate racemase family protein [Sulfitobacter sp. LCG007]